MARLLEELEDASYMEDKVTVAKLQMTMDKKGEAKAHRFGCFEYITDPIWEPVPFGGVPKPWRPLQSLMVKIHLRQRWISIATIESEFLKEEPVFFHLFFHLFFSSPIARHLYSG